MEKPADLFDRNREWRALDEFVRSAGAGLRLAVVYGRRRQGKSHLLRRLVEAGGGLYVMPLEEARTPALQRFSDLVAGTVMGLPPGGIRFDAWDVALRTTMSALAQRAGRGTPPTLVIDELPYLLAHSPEIPSVLQALHDESRHERGAPPVRIIVCGSALSIMTDLLSGSRALRGRALVDLCLKPFTYRRAASFWGIEDPELAVQVHAIFGGTPGYRDLVTDPPPKRTGGLEGWLAKHVLSPTHVLFREADYLLREDPRVTDRALYYSILTAIAAGGTTPTGVGAAVGRPAQSLAYPLSVLESAGFVDRVDDVLLQRRPRLLLADPIIRFHQLVTAPRVAMLEEGHAADAWRSAAETFASNILGPHFEHLARAWVVLHGRDEGLRERAGVVGPTVVNDPAGRTRHEIDVVGLAEGQAPRSRHPRVVLLGEAKHSARRLTMFNLDRLDRLRSLLAGRGVDASGAQLALFTRSGVDAHLARAAARRDDVVLVDVPRLYGHPRKP